MWTRNRAVSSRAGRARASDPRVDVTQGPPVVRDGSVSGEHQPSQVGRRSDGPLDQQKQTFPFPASALNVQGIMRAHVG
jgi:hypothetical protein